MNRRFRPLLLPAALLLGCTSTPPPPPPEPPTFAPVAIADRPGLHNVFHLTDCLYSGSGPDGEAGFRSLSELGVKTVLSVDGATPDVKLAERFGLRYVHLPVGYDGVPREAAVRIARAVRDLPGPVYLHCHHGKHRGPAAAVAAVRCLDERCPASAAVGFLRTAGTDPNYAGLYASVEGSTAATQAELDRAGGDFPAVAPVPGLVRMMVELDERWDRMKLVRQAGWKAPPGQADLDPPHEALQLREHFREAARLPEVAKRTEEFRKLLADGEADLGRLESLLREKQTGNRLDEAFKRVADGCIACHRRWRDVPR